MSGDKRGFQRLAAALWRRVRWKVGFDIMTPKWMPLMGTGLAVRMDMLNEAQARINHGQSLDRLAERGGLGADEALAIAERREWRRRGDIDALKALALMMSTLR